MLHADDGQLHAYLDGELARSGGDIASFEAHLAVCPTCQASLEEARALRSAAHNLLSVSSPAEGPPPPLHFPRAERQYGEPELKAALRRRTIVVLSWAASISVALGVGWLARELAFGGSDSTSETRIATSASTNTLARVSAPGSPADQPDGGSTAAATPTDGPAREDRPAGNDPSVVSSPAGPSSAVTAERSSTAPALTDPSPRLPSSPPSGLSNPSGELALSPSPSPSPAARPDASDGVRSGDEVAPTATSPSVSNGAASGTGPVQVAAIESGAPPSSAGVASVGAVAAADEPAGQTATNPPLASALAGSRAAAPSDAVADDAARGAVQLNVAGGAADRRAALGLDFGPAPGLLGQPGPGGLAEVRSPDGGFRLGGSPAGSGGPGGAGGPGAGGPGRAAGGVPAPAGGAASSGGNGPAGNSAADAANPAAASCTPAPIVSFRRAEVTYFVGVPLADTVLAGAGTIRYSPANRGGQPTDQPIHGQLVRLDQIGGYDADGVRATLETRGDRTVVVVPWTTDSGCAAAAWSGSARFAQPLQPGFFAVRLRHPDFWADGRPTFDALPADTEPYPYASAFWQDLDAGALTAGPPLSAAEYASLYASLPERDRLRADPLAATAAAWDWERANPELARRYPAAQVLTELRAALPGR